MCQFPLFETLALVNGQFQNLQFHQQRINYSFSHFLKEKCHLNLDGIIIPKTYFNGKFRCRIDYNSHNFKISFSNYIPPIIQHFQCVYTRNLDYQFKLTDRKRLDSLKNLQTDEVIIINNGFVSDCTIGNLLFLRNGKWYSPQHYLLKGTQLSSLTTQRKVTLLPIAQHEIFDYEKIMVINALNPFNNDRAIPICSETIFT